MPFGALLDFSKVPISLTPTPALIQFLALRKLKVRGAVSREGLEDKVKEVLEQGASAPQPVQRATIGQNVSNYVDLEALTEAGPNGLIWDQTVNTLKLMRESFVALDATAINKIFGERKNGIRQRALLRIKSGHLDPRTLKSTRAKLRGTSIECFLFVVKVTPSMKAETYQVVIAANAATGEYKPAPCSRCDCPNGRLLCSHMLASLSMIYLVQQHPSWCLGDLIAAMPPPVKSMQNKPIPFDFVFGENEADDAVRRAGKAVEDEMSNSAPANHSNASAWA